MKMAKIVPLIIVAIALIGLYFEFQTYKMLTAKKCNCGDEEYTRIEE